VTTGSCIKNVRSIHEEGHGISTSSEDDSEDGRLKHYRYVQLSEFENSGWSLRNSYGQAESSDGQRSALSRCGK